MPGNLPEVAELFNKLQAEAYTWFSIIDLSDMFFAIPLDEESREVTTFTLDNKQYQFKRVPQGYKNSPIIAHMTLQWSIDQCKLHPKTLVLSYVDDIIIAGNEAKEVELSLKALVETLTKNAWTMNPDKIQKPVQQVKFLGIVYYLDIDWS
jgi:hypothetical protein